MAKREGVAESDREDFRRRTKAIHGNISHGLKGKSRLGDDYIKSIADALEADQTEALKEAGRLQVRDKKPTPSKSPAQQKIDALLAILNDEEKEEAISLLETFTKNRKKAKEAASRARTAKT